MTAAGNAAPASGAADDAAGPNGADPSVMDGSSSSKVTVEYHDPSGLFPLIQNQLIPRLPLRNLHWKSPNRPLRSIDSLHVDLVPSTANVTVPGLSVPEGPSSTKSGPTSAEIVRPPVKERRHQIPGLRQTPYLKVYLLRCDDSETYKATARKQLREWVKAHTPPSQSSSSANTQENHDAFEWMILHVVLPNTPAASQPRGSMASAAGTGSTEKSSTSSRWTRGTSTIFEKIRADFNVASKNSPDRVAQVRLQKDGIPPHMLPVGAGSVSPPVNETPQEQEIIWNDVISKFKTLILLSFDLRVSQYEEDIREKDSQRALPGWNFCTFFILKEGLARGFESAGLVEDALLGYDELSVGLDSIIRDQANEGSEAGGTILNHSEDLYQRAVEILESSQKANGERQEVHPHFHDDTPINSRKKDYRGLILSNNISIFDFRCYIFARQMSLFLRLGNSHSARTDLAAKLQHQTPSGGIQRTQDDRNVGTGSGPASNESEDLLFLAELCSRALYFITFAARLLREDLLNGAKAHDMTLPERLIDNLVSSWTFAAAQQVLEETSTSSLPISKFTKDTTTSSSGKMRTFGKHGEEQKFSVAEPKTRIHPTRSSSLSHGRPSLADPPYAQPPASAQVVFENGQYQERLPHQGNTSQPQVKSGVQGLAGNRAQLLILERRVLEHIGKMLNWRIGWTAVIAEQNPQKEDLSDVDLNEPEEKSEQITSPKEAQDMTSSTVGLAAAALVNAVSSIEQFRDSYENLSDLIVKHYMAAGQMKSGESVLGDLAALRFELGDFAAAAAYFGRMASLFAESRWNFVQMIMLRMYAQCLKKLNRKDEYVRTLLDLLAKSASKRKSIRSSSKQTSAPDVSNDPKDWLDDDKVDTTGVFQELINFSEQLPYDMPVQMTKYFGDINVEPYVRHFDDKDGFQLRLQFRHLLEDEIEVKQAKVRLISATSAQGKEVWLESSDVTRVQTGVAKIWLSSNINTTGPYIVDKIVVETKRISFVHEPFIKTEVPTPLGITMSTSAASLRTAKKCRVLCFPRTEAFQARIYLSHFIHIDKQRSIEIECSSGWNDIQHAEIRLRSASAGLRLRTANTTVSSGDVIIADKPNPGVIGIQAMGPHTTACFRVPYELETILPELSIKIEVVYFTKNGQFQYLSSFKIPIDLPLDVNVHDHFKNDSLFSKFNIKTANNVPLEVLDVGLEGYGEFVVDAPRKFHGPIHVFPKQPISITYKIRKRPAKDPLDSKNIQVSESGCLALSVDYRCTNEDVLERVRQLFSNAIAHSPFSRLGRLLEWTFCDALEHRILPNQWEKSTLLDRVDIGSFGDLDWGECMDSLPHSIREDVRAWVQKFHEDHKLISLATCSDPTSLISGVAPPSPYPHRRIIITVTIPPTHILHTASLSLVSPDQPSVHSSAIAVVGKPLMASLRIKHTRRWAIPSSLVSAARLSSPDDPIEFVYIIEANPEIWLIAGQRRGHFTAKEDQEHTFPMVLLPLKSGSLLLPTVDIRARVKGAAEGDKKGGVEQLNCETDYLGYAECVMVVPDVRSSTVGVEIGGIGKGAVVWLESQGRGGEGEGVEVG